MSSDHRVLLARKALGPALLTSAAANATSNSPFKDDDAVPIHKEGGARVLASRTDALTTGRQVLAPVAGYVVMLALNGFWPFLVAFLLMGVISGSRLAVLLAPAAYLLIIVTLLVAGTVDLDERTSMLSSVAIVSLNAAAVAAVGVLAQGAVGARLSSSRQQA